MWSNILKSYIMFKKLSTSLLLCLIGFGAFFGNIYQEVNKNWFHIQIAQRETFAAPTTDLQLERENSNLQTPENSRLQSWANETTESSKEMQKMYQAIAEGLNIFLGFITLIVSPAVMFAWWLMSPDWTSGDLFGLRDVFYKLWITLSNITYFIYAILLVFIAVATIFWSDHYGYKALLPKLALGILMVPFTWWAVQFVISLSTVVTASVMSIPHETYGKLIDQKSVKWGFWEKESIPKEIIIENNQKFDTVLKDTGTNTSEWNSCSSGKWCISPRQFLESGGGMYGYMMVYAYGIFKINEVKKINTNIDAVKSLVDIINQWLVGSIMFLVFWILTLALIFMLMTRAMMLWVYTIFSPFLTLDFVLGGSLLKNVSDSFSIKEFIGLAFVPAVVGLSLSFGLVIVGAVTSGGTNEISKAKCDAATISWNWCTIMGIMGNPENKITRKVVGKGYTNNQESTDLLEGDPNNNTWRNDGAISREKSDVQIETQNIISIGGINVVFKGNIRAWDIDEYAGSTSDAMSIISAGGGIFGTIVVDLIAIMFIWMAFMAAKWINKVVNAAAKPFEELGNKVWSMAASAPKYMPLPIPGGSIAWASKWIGQLESIKEQMASKRFDDSGFGKFVKNMNPEIQLNEEMKTKYNKLYGGNKNDYEYQKDLKEFVEKSTGQQALYNKELINELSKGLTGMDDWNLTSAGYSANVRKALLDVKKSNLSEDEKAILAAAIIKWYSPSNIWSDLSKALSWAKSHLNNSWWSSSSSNNDAQSNINVMINGNDKYSFVAPWFNLDKMKKDEILKEISKHPENFKNIDEWKLREELKKIFNDTEVNDFIKMVNDSKKSNESGK